MSSLPKWHASAACVLVLLSSSFVRAQVPSGGPPVVGVITAQYKPMMETTEVAGRIHAGAHRSRPPRHHVPERKAV